MSHKICVKNIVYEVITLQEVSEILSIVDSTFRNKVLNGEFENGKYMKTAKVVLFYKSAILERKAKLD